jgi:predicted dienelactone hydrolase
MNTKVKWILITLGTVALVAIAAAIGFRLTSQAAASAPADQTGPFKVGFVSNTYDDSSRSDAAGGPRPIQTYIWYPAAAENDGDTLPPAVYDLGLPGLPPFSSMDFEAYGVDPAYQEVAASKEGPFPLVVLSPGGGTLPLFYVHIGARLASHGFVVAVPYNYGEGALGEPVQDADGLQHAIRIYIDRARDIQYLMTRLVADSNESDNLLSGTVQADQIAVSGHSVGGLAALALAGGNDLTCDLAGLDPNLTPPELCVPILPDPRIKAIVPLDPAGLSNNLHYAELARIKIPSMLMGREWNTMVESGTANEELLLARPHSAIQGRPNYRVEFANYQHMSFSSTCSCMSVLRELNGDQATDASLAVYCPKEPLPPDETGNLMTRYMIAFLKTVLVGEKGYREMLTPGYALENEPFVEFFETEEGSPGETVEAGYFGYFKHQSDTERATALEDPPMPVP